MRTWMNAIAVAVTCAGLMISGVAVAPGVARVVAPRSTGAAEPAAGRFTAPHRGPARTQSAGADESIFVPVTPCRIVDTRLAGGALANAGTTSYRVTGSGSLATQGGSATGCGIPSSANAIAAVITAVNPTHLGYLKAFPGGTSAPASSILNYPAVTTTGSGATIPISNSTSLALSIYNFGGPTQLIIDVTGYYSPQIAALVDVSGGMDGNTPRVLSAVRLSTGTYVVTIDRVLGNCAVQATAYNFGNTAIANDIDTSAVVHVVVTNSAGAATDDYVQFSVSC